MRRRRGKGARQALLIGVGGLLWPLPPMLAAAGFSVDVATLPSAHFRHRVHVRRVVRRPDRVAALLAAAALDARHHYDWIIVGDDDTLLALRDHPGLTPEQKVRLGPVTAPEHLAHLGSKVELSQRLSAAGIPTPRYAVVQSLRAALASTDELGWPVYLKADEGNAGRGVARCIGPDELRRAWPMVADGHGAGVLVQEALPGATLDLSAIYISGELIHFTSSEILGTVPGRGLATIKRYQPATSTPPRTVEAMRTIGTVLGIDGFVNLGAVIDTEGNPSFIEADLRPTVWAPYGSAVGDDPVLRLAAYYDEGRQLLDEQLTAGAGTDPEARVDIAFFTRMRRRDLLRNRAGVWGDFPWRSPDASAMLVKHMVDGGEAHAWRHT